MELTFTDGLAEVALADGTILSVLNAERQRFLDDSPLFELVFALAKAEGAPDSALASVATVHAEHGDREDPPTYEVALRASGEELIGQPIPGWGDYVADTLDGEVYTYGYVTMDLIDAYVEKVGRA